MPYVKKEQIAKAKQMDLLTYLQTYDPNELVAIGANTYCTRTHDSLKISNGKWCWWSHHIGGRSALDYLIKVRGMDFTGAVIHLCDTSGSTHVVYKKKDKKEPPTRFTLPEANDNNKRVIEYLKGRSIDTEIINYCIRERKLYQSKQYGNVVFVGFDTKNIPRYATIRGTSAGSRFMIDISGSNKRFSFSIPAKEQKNSVFLFESALDLMSYATLVKLKGQDWRSINYLSLAGVYLPKKNIKESTVPLALAQYLKDNPNIIRIVLCLDNDLAGREATKAITMVLQEQYEVGNRPPPQGKDYNDMLRIELGLQHGKKQNDIIR